jgi:hypothetical protein
MEGHPGKMALARSHNANPMCRSERVPRIQPELVVESLSKRAGTVIVPEQIDASDAGHGRTIGGTLYWNFTRKSVLQS